MKQNFFKITSLAFILVASLMIIDFFSDHMTWKIFDYIIISILFIMTGFAIDFVSSKLDNKKYKLIAIIIVICFFLIIWAELAVGVLETILAGN